MNYKNFPNAKQFRLDIVRVLSSYDEQYKDMLKQCAELEKEYNRVLGEVSTEQMDILCDFLMHCEAMSDRLLELACTHMVFPE